MGYLARWILGVVQQRRLKFYLEPLESKLQIESLATERLEEHVRVKK
jgi:hypothetical protein